MTRALALGFIVTSPVIRPTSWNSSYNSLYFWLLRALKRMLETKYYFWYYLFELHENTAVQSVVPSMLPLECIFLNLF